MRCGVSGLPPHDHIEVTFDVCVILGPVIDIASDTFTVTADGSVRLETGFANGRRAQSRSSPHTDQNIATLGWLLGYSPRHFARAHYELALRFPHRASSLRLDFACSRLEP